MKRIRSPCINVVVALVKVKPLENATLVMIGFIELSYKSAVIDAVPRAVVKISAVLRSYESVAVLVSSYNVTATPCAGYE